MSDRVLLPCNQPDRIFDGLQRVANLPNKKDGLVYRIALALVCHTANDLLDITTIVAETYPAALYHFEQFGQADGNPAPLWEAADTILAVLQCFTDQTVKQLDDKFIQEFKAAWGKRIWHPENFRESKR